VSRLKKNSDEVSDKKIKQLMEQNKNRSQALKKILKSFVVPEDVIEKRESLTKTKK
jgi:hypothetical protein